MQVKEAFAALLNSASAELEKVQHEGAAYFGSGDTAHVREAADRVEKIQGLVNELRQLQRKWEALLPEEPARQVHQPVVKTDYGRTPPGVKTPQERYRRPILRALVEMGGKGRVGDVLERVQKMMADVFNDVDNQKLKGGGDFRWRNTAQWERYVMVQEGLLSDRSPNGTWEITEEGRKYLNR